MDFNSTQAVNIKICGILYRLWWQKKSNAEMAAALSISAPLIASSAHHQQPLLHTHYNIEPSLSVFHTKRTFNEFASSTQYTDIPSLWPLRKWPPPSRRSNPQPAKQPKHNSTTTCWAKLSPAPQATNSRKT